jgi:hypothetical protein
MKLSIYFFLLSEVHRGSASRLGFSIHLTHHFGGRRSCARAPGEHSLHPVIALVASGLEDGTLPFHQKPSTQVGTHSKATAFIVHPLLLPLGTLLLFCGLRDIGNPITPYARPCGCVAHVGVVGQLDTFFWQRAKSDL